MWSEQIKRRQKALKLVRTVGAEVKREIGKSQIRQLLEIGILGLRGYSASDYYVLRLYNDYTQAGKYMNRGQFNAARWRWNPPVQGVFEFNKWIFGHYCAAIGIPSPTCYGLFHRQTGMSAAGEPLRDLEGLRRLLAAIAGPVVFKPIAGSHGDGVMVIDGFDAQSGTLTRANKQQLRLEELYELLTGRDIPWLLQAKVRQHPALLALHESSLNTSRIITLMTPDGNVEVLGAVLRIGTGTGEVDNTTGGGVAAPIDLASGTCGPAISESTIRRIARHPDSDQPIEGFVVPDWDRMKDTAITAHRRLPFARSLGWDVAFGEAGPVILEVNGTWYQNHVQMTGRSLWDTTFGQPPGAPPRPSRPATPAG
jgi:hypothetical protein